MTDFIGGVTTRFGFSATWMFAVAIALGAGITFLLPTVVNVGWAPDPTHGNPAVNTLYFALAAAGFGFAMGALSTPLYQFLEGYSAMLPSPARDWLIDSQRSRKSRLVWKIRRAPSWWCSDSSR
ncbi:MAG: hypothetical protein E6J41_05325 [Chloroflexi bacterium]|nr:MAG: hypothetical protein E6J41_05325 [Chloroflexota bacterium]